MSRSAGAASGKALDATDDDIVYDFLYYDARRIGSFLAQFDDSGHLQQVTQEETAGSGRTSSFSLKGTGAVKVEIPLTDTGLDVEGEGGLEHERTKEGSESASRVYDPLWTNARAFLGFLKKRHLIQDELRKARVGQFVLATGHLVVLDLAMLKGAWERPLLRRRIAAESRKGDSAPNRHERRRQSATGQAQEADDHDFLFEFLSILPHSLQGHLLVGGIGVWCNLAPDSLVGLSSDLVLKHGSHVAGRWSILGILDALPDVGGDPDKPAVLTGVEEAIVNLAGTMVGKLTARFAPMTRRMMGRPNGAFGVTPLLIYREVSGPATGEAEVSEAPQSADEGAASG